MKHIFFWTLLTVWASACTGPGSVKKQVFECYIRYMVPEGQLHVEAAVREALSAQGAPELVDIPGGVRYNDEEMQKITLRGPQYRFDKPGGYRLQHTFKWQDASGNARTFGTDMAPITRFSFDSEPLSTQQPATLRWEGGGMEKGEALVFLWERAAGNLTVSMEASGTPGMSEITFPAAKMRELAPGQWTLYLVRKKAVRTDTDGLNASALLEYFSEVQTFQIN